MYIRICNVMSLSVDIFQTVMVVFAQIMEYANATDVSVMRVMKGNTVKAVR